MVSHTCEIRFHDVIGQSTVHMYSCAKILKHGRPSWPSDYVFFFFKYYPGSAKPNKHVCDYKISFEFDYGSNQTERSELSALELKRKPDMLPFVYPPAYANTNQSAPYFVKIYMTIRSRTSSIMGLIGPNQPELFPLELGKKMLHTTPFTI